MNQGKQKKERNKTDIIYILQKSETGLLRAFLRKPHAIFSKLRGLIAESHVGKIGCEKFGQRHISSGNRICAFKHMHVKIGTGETKSQKVDNGE